MKSEIELRTTLGEFSSAVSRAAEGMKPYLVANHVYEIARLFNEFYHACPILTEADELKKARLLLVDCIAKVLNIGLNLLGIIAPEEM